MRKAVRGIMIPMAREYPLVSHCPLDTEMCRSCIMGGRAVVRAVCKKEEAMQVTMRLTVIQVLRV